MGGGTKRRAAPAAWGKHKPPETTACLPRTSSGLSMVAPQLPNSLPKEASPAAGLAPSSRHRVLGGTFWVGRVLGPAWPCSPWTSAGHFHVHPGLTSRAGVAQGAADFVLVQVGPRDHQDVGDLAQGAVIRGLAPHLLGRQGGAAGDVVGAGALPGAALPLSQGPAGGSERLCLGERAPTSTAPKEGCDPHRPVGGVNFLVCFQGFG